MITSYLRWLASLTFGMMVPVFHYSIFLEVVSKLSIGFKVSRPRSAGQERGIGTANRPD
jgi:hypothetical protein